MFGIAVAAGALGYYHKLKMGRDFSWIEFCLELVTSGICGVVAFWIFTGLGVNQYLAAAACAIAGHMGTRSLLLGERVLKRFVNLKE